jgi:uncharacterized RDD family membrane protein YckC
MKCPKCSYLGFETGDRCRNCGYDFSLLAAPEPDPGELSLKTETGDLPVGELWLESPTATVTAEATTNRAQSPLETPIPLFAPPAADHDDPLINLPAEPRAPLSVRRAPETQPRSRPAVRPPRFSNDVGLMLEFAEDTPRRVEPAPRPVVAPETTRPAGLGRRVSAALTDHAILLGVDAIVIYSTLRMVALTMGDWQALPAVPLLAFLGLVKLAYFSAFTAIGGQTIGKMAAGIRVVADEHFQLDPGRAIGRTLTGAVSFLSFGLGLVPALFNIERRTLHDHVAHTRVVELPSA